ncbi:expressed unknown protein [Seminavis robusta]|uniref:WW domain-containing protein n=1 Tax=Seminavis robusta TaxID=568900 RepID=A0A9N8D8X7_9STRA|nr:expressed unknown protein [Seminavis robusta]|eukprot:Sro35_g022270.1 n/a (827) ;mRNA; f:60541-63198
MTEPGFYRNEDNSLCYVDEYGLEYNPTPNVDPWKAYNAGVKYVQCADGIYYYHNVEAILAEAQRQKEQEYAASNNASSGNSTAVGAQEGTAASPSSSSTGTSPLPSGWSEHVDPASGMTYYLNAHNNTSQWERPQAPTESKPEVSAPPQQGSYRQVETVPQEAQVETPTREAFTPQLQDRHVSMSPEVQAAPQVNDTNVVQEQEAAPKVADAQEAAEKQAAQAKFDRISQFIQTQTDTAPTALAPAVNAETKGTERISDGSGISCGENTAATAAPPPAPEPEPDEESDDGRKGEDTGDPLDDSNYWPYEESESEEEEEQPLPPGWIMELKWGMPLYVNKSQGIATYFRPKPETENEQKEETQSPEQASEQKSEQISEKTSGAVTTGEVKGAATPENDDETKSPVAEQQVGASATSPKAVEGQQGAEDRKPAEVPAKNHQSTALDKQSTTKEETSGPQSATKPTNAPSGPESTKQPTTKGKTSGPQNTAKPTNVPSPESPSARNNVPSAADLREQIRLFVEAGGDLKDILPANVEVQPRRQADGEKPRNTRKPPLPQKPSFRKKPSFRRKSHDSDLSRSAHSTRSEGKVKRHHDSELSRSVHSTRSEGKVKRHHDSELSRSAHSTRSEGKKPTSRAKSPMRTSRSETDVNRSGHSPRSEGGEKPSSRSNYSHHLKTPIPRKRPPKDGSPPGGKEGAEGRKKGQRPGRSPVRRPSNDSAADAANSKTPENGKRRSHPEGECHKRPSKSPVRRSSNDDTPDEEPKTRSRSVEATGGRMRRNPHGSRDCLRKQRSARNHKEEAEKRQRPSSTTPGPDGEKVAGFREGVVF